MRSSSRLIRAISLVAGLYGPAALSDEGSLRLPESYSANVELTVHDTHTEITPSDVLRVYVGSSATCCAGKPSIAGDYLVEGNTVTFDPAFDFIEGQPYTVMNIYKDATNEPVIALKEFNIQPTANVEIPRVIGIYPSADNIPENTLRFYIHFASAMKPHMSTHHIKLIDSGGTDDTAAFMNFKQELWSADRKRLTLLMDPGRIKRGVASNQTLGPALLEGKSYSIVVEQGWQNAKESKTAPRFEKSFTVSRAIRTLPDVKTWQIKPLRAFTHDPLLIEFDRTFDHQFGKSGITVMDERGQRIDGKVSLVSNETGWRFEPLKPWTKEKIHILVDPKLEDVAGNNFKELLDHPIDTGIQRPVENRIVLEYSPLAG